MQRPRIWFLMISWIVPMLISTMAKAAPAWNTTGAWVNGPMASGRAPRVSVLAVAHTGEVSGAFSGLVRSSQGFYWTHTDQGTGIDGWIVKLVKLKINPSGAEILDVIPMRDESGALVTGDQLDPEDIIEAPDGTLWLSDEIHPLIVQVSRDGQILRRVEAPERFKQRQTGRGLEGLTISPDGTTLYAILQTALSTTADKSHTWILAYDMRTGSFTEHSYMLDRPSAYSYPAGVKPWIGASGLAAVGPGEVLVLERDNLSGANTRMKRIYRVSIPDAPSEAPLQKQLVLDVYALGYNMEKLEGIAVPNPTTMVLLNDNDGDADNPTEVWYLQW